MGDPFHPGEIAVQERAGARGMAQKLGTGIRPEIPDRAREFLVARDFAIVASIDARGAVWASLLTGAPGFLQVADERRLRVRALPLRGDPLADDLRDGAALGLLVIDLQGRRRIRLNGVAHLREDGFDVVTREVFANCPKYIQSRAPEELDASTSAREPGVSRRDRLDADQQRWIGSADTFFVATAHRTAGADASHRGGDPGFVRVHGERRIAWPDYAGNNMFQTLGNLAEDGRAGLLFLDFEHGDTLQLTGRATVDWDPARAAAIAGAERLVDYEIAEVVEIRGRGAGRFRLLDRSPFNPA
jgi:predicted pyridoxine 5'-phosphate oxidase superfamily flavin-nucleotide-binding protein